VIRTAAAILLLLLYVGREWERGGRAAERLDVLERSDASIAICSIPPPTALIIGTLAELSCDGRF
jgi:hypothetical protein